MFNKFADLFTQTMERLGMKRPGLSAYVLRHVHRTIADEVGDKGACDRIMGHADKSMAAEYIERIDDDRLRRVADHVRDWLFSSEKQG